MRIVELMIGVQNLDLVLPEFQREYVWEREQAKQLIVSLFRDYPTGSLLFWKTNNPPDIKNDPRNLYFDLASGDFQYYQSSKMDSQPTWVRVTDCFTRTDINPFQIAKKVVEDEGEQFNVAQNLNDHLNRLRNIKEKMYPVQTVPSTATIDEAIDVFDRVNSLGTKLTEAELALAHICGKWPQARRVMKEKIEHFATKRFYFDLNFMVRSLTGIVKGRALFDTIHGASEDDLKSGWTKLTKILAYLTAVLPKYAVHSHHIFPSSRLYKEGGYGPANHLHSKIVNEIANRAFLTGDTNWSLSDDRPAEYMPEIQQNYPRAVEKQFIPARPGLWKMESYEAFLAERRKLIADAFNKLMRELLEEVPTPPPLSISDLIAAGESALLEFKSSLHWDVREQRVNKELQKVVAKTITNDGLRSLFGCGKPATLGQVQGNRHVSLQYRTCVDGIAGLSEQRCPDEMVGEGNRRHLREKGLVQ